MKELVTLLNKTYVKLYVHITCHTLSFVVYEQFAAYSAPNALK